MISRTNASVPKIPRYLLVLTILAPSLGCGGGLQYHVKEGMLARVPPQSRRTLDPFTEAWQKSQSGLAQARQDLKLAEHAVEIADAKESLAEDRVELMNKGLKSAQESKKLEAQASAEADIDVAKSDHAQAKAALDLAKAQHVAAEAKLIVAEKKVLLDEALLELEKAKLAYAAKQKINVSNFDKQAATARKELGEAEENLADEGKEVQSLQAKHETAVRQATKVRLKYGKASSVASS